MTDQKPKSSNKIEIKLQPKTTAIRVAKETAKLIRRELTKINRKEFGRRIRADEFLVQAINKLTELDFRSLQENSLSNADKLEIAYRLALKSSSMLTKEQFLGELLNQLERSNLNAPAEQRVSQKVARDNGPDQEDML